MMCGDKIVTSVPPHWYTKWLSRKIQKEQRTRGYARWDGTHVLTYLGDLPRALLIRIANQVEPFAKGNGITASEFVEYSMHSDWCLSATWPVTKLVRWEEVARRGHYRLYYRREYDAHLRWFSYPPARHHAFYSELAEHEIRCAGLNLLGEHYDIGQLADFIENRKRHRPRSQWGMFWDWGSEMRVCSVAAHVIEGVARERVHSLIGDYPWVEPFLDTQGEPCAADSILPADYENSKHYHCYTEVE